MSKLQQRKKKYVSASEVNMYRSDPARWVLGYGMGVFGQTNKDMARGNAVEKALEYILSEEFVTIDEAIELAIKEFNRETALVVGQEDRDKERADIDGFVRMGFEALSQFGVPTSTQNELLFEYEGLPVPVKGFDDFQFEQDGVKLSIDLKTTKKCPSAISDTHKLQAAVYATALPEHQIKFCYVTPKRFAIYDYSKEEAEEMMQEFVVAVQAMDNMLAITDDMQKLARIFAPNYSSFYWKDPIVRAEAKRIFGV